MDASSSEQNTDKEQKTGSKRKHVTLTISNKLKVIEKLEKGVSGKLISQMFGISRQTVSDIKKHTPAIKAYASQFDVTNDKSSFSKRMTLKRSKDERLETALYTWYIRQRRNDVNVQISDLIAVAENLKKQIGIIDLNCKSNWLTHFRYRYNIKDSDVGIVNENANENETMTTVGMEMEEQKPLKSDYSISVNEYEESDEREGQNDAAVSASAAVASSSMATTATVTRVPPAMLPLEFLIKEEVGDTSEWDYVPSEGNQESQAGGVASAAGDGDSDTTCSSRKNNSPFDAASAARDGIDAVINYVGYSTNRKLWSYYEQLRIVRELIIEDQKKMLGNSLPSTEAQFKFPYI